MKKIQELEIEDKYSLFTHTHTHAWAMIIKEFDHRVIPEWSSNIPVANSAATTMAD